MKTVITPIFKYYEKVNGRDFYLVHVTGNQLSDKICATFDEERHFIDFDDVSYYKFPNLKNIYNEENTLEINYRFYKNSENSINLTVDIKHLYTALVQKFSANLLTLIAVVRLINAMREKLIADIDKDIFFTEEDKISKIKLFEFYGTNIIIHLSGEITDIKI